MRTITISQLNNWMFKAYLNTLSSVRTFEEPAISEHDYDLTGKLGDPGTGGRLQ